MKSRIVLLGPPASGKGTVAAKIHAEFRIPATSTGAILREEMKRGTELGRLANSYTHDGGLAPDDLIMGVVNRWLAEHDGKYLFDGFPRTLVQAEQFEVLAAKRGTPPDVVLFFDASMETIRSRVANRVTCSDCGTSFNIGRHVRSIEDPCPQCGGKLVRRTDDTMAALEKRMRQYEDLTKPVLDFYRNRGILKPVDANRDSNEVYWEVREILENS